MPQEVGSAQDQGLDLRVRLSQDKQGQGLGLAEISKVKGYSQKWQIPARELRRGLMDEARLVTHDADG